MSYQPLNLANGSSIVGDSNTYTNFTPLSASIKGALSGIDSALGALSFANKALSNLTSTSINVTLMPSADNGSDLGGISSRWSHLYLGSYVEQGEIATPASPTTNRHRVYFKSDGNLYTLNSSGTETQVGAGAGSGANQALSNLTSPTAINQNLLFGADGVNSIGASAASRPNNLFLKSFQEWGEISTPSNPPANNHRVYIKSDGNMYMLNSSGVETQVNGGSGPSPSEFSNGSLSGSVTIDWNNGTNQSATITGDVVITMANAPVGASLLLQLDQDGVGGHTYSFIDDIEFGNLGPISPSGSYRTDLVEFVARTGYFVASYVTNYQQPGTYSNVNSLSFNGSNQYVDFGNNINLERTDAFSWSFWIKPTSLGGFPTFIGKLGGSANFAGYQIWSQGSGKVYVNLQQIFSVNCIQVHTTAAPLTTAAWQNVTITYDGSSNASGVTIYVNGVSQAMTTDINNLTASILTTNPLFFGADDGSGAEDFYSGLMDEVSCWMGVLNGTDVTNLYNSGNPTNLNLLGTASTLIHWWRMGDPADNATTSDGIVDRVGSVDGTCHNMISGNIGTDIP